VRTLRSGLTAFGVVALAACGGTGGVTTSTVGIDETPKASGSTLEGQVLVSAAASLTDAFAEMEAAFEADHPGTM
jgi:molybdate transport system substrate-binding protein